MTIRTCNPDELVLSNRARPITLVAAIGITLLLAAYAWYHPMWLQVFIAGLAVLATCAVAVALSFSHEVVFDAHRKRVIIQRSNGFVQSLTREVPFASVRGVMAKQQQRRYTYTLLTDDGPIAMSPLSYSRQPPDGPVAEIRAWLRAHDLPTGG